MTKTIACVALALLGFAANSLLCRAALAETPIDYATFSAWRLASGAAVLAGIAAAARSGPPRRHGDWRAAAALFVYAFAFAFAYRELHAGVGALLLFGAVQVTMLAAGVARGERLRAEQWLGALLACLGLVVLKLPWGTTPAAPWPSVASMLLAGMAWGVYSLLGRGASAPLAATAGNFLRATPLALVAWFLLADDRSLAPDGIGYAIASGALASGVGYALWYAALPWLRASQAALLQLLVPVLTALAGVAWLREPLDARLLAGGGAILGGVVLALRAPARG